MKLKLVFFLASHLLLEASQIVSPKEHMQNAEIATLVFFTCITNGIATPSKCPESVKNTIFSTQHSSFLNNLFAKRNFLLQSQLKGKSFMRNPEAVKTGYKKRENKILQQPKAK